MDRKHIKLGTERMMQPFYTQRKIQVPKIRVPKDFRVVHEHYFDVPEVKEGVLLSDYEGWSIEISRQKSLSLDAGQLNNTMVYYRTPSTRLGWFGQDVQAETDKEELQIWNKLRRKSRTISSETD